MAYLLRTDLHTLFDCGLLAVDPETRIVVIADALKASAYARRGGKVLRRPKEETNSPSKRNLEKALRTIQGGGKISAN